jgi:hypothetical protein
VNELVNASAKLPPVSSVWTDEDTDRFVMLYNMEVARPISLSDFRSDVRMATTAINQALDDRYSLPLRSQARHMLDLAAPSTIVPRNDLSNTAQLAALVMEGESVDEDLSAWIHTVPLPLEPPVIQGPGSGTATEEEPVAQPHVAEEPTIRLSLTNIQRAVQPDAPLDHRAVTGKWERVVLDENAGRSADRRAHGKVRMSTQEQMALSAFRRLYKKTFNEIIDLEEFVGNDLYARMLLNCAVKAEDLELAAVAYTFLDSKGRPRLHRRAGFADVEFNPRAE